MRYPRQTILSTLNKHTWLNKANLLFIEAPVGVGYSYSSTDKDLELTDETTASDLYNAIKYFLRSKFTTFKSSEIIIASEGDAAIFTTLMIE